MLNKVPTRRLALRNHVSAAHYLLDGAIGEWRDQQDYSCYLLNMAGFRIAAEQALSDIVYPRCFGDWHPVSTTGALLQDLTALRLHSPILQSIHKPLTSSALLGMCYTLEGSSLGAHVLFKRAITLGYSREYGAAHLHVQMSPPAQWRHFLDILERAPAFDIDDAKEAASTMFRHACLAMTGVEPAGKKAHD